MVSVVRTEKYPVHEVSRARKEMSTLGSKMCEILKEYPLTSYLSPEAAILYGDCLRQYEYLEEKYGC